MIQISLNLINNDSEEWILSHVHFLRLNLDPSFKIRKNTKYKKNIILMVQMYTTPLLVNFAIEEILICDLCLNPIRRIQAL
jgi:hypothetical protein